jgi:outer membrane protein assembly factor BamA
MGFHLMLGYAWNNKLIRRFEFIPFSANFFKVTDSSEEFRDLLSSNSQLKNTYQDQVIMGRRFSFYYNSRSRDYLSNKTNDFYLNLNINTAGNLVHLFRNIFTEGTYENGQNNEFLGAPYAQFSKIDIDLRYYLRLNSKNRLAFRFIGGTGIAYGNASNLPYTHQFAAGGSSSIRAFPSRSLGPGEYNVPDSLLEFSTFFDQTADIKLQLNLEYRFNILGKLNGAVFVDAGNIWTIRSEISRPGGRFYANSFFKQIAMGGGFGLRYDLDFLILRLDIATPIRLPNGPEDERWIIRDFSMNQPTWPREKLLFNIALGYPF